MRGTAAAAAALALLAPAASASADPVTSWAKAQIAVVTSQGLLGGDPATFRPDDPLTAGDLAELYNAVSGLAPAVPADPAAPVTIAALDSTLVRALGLRPAAATFLRAIRAAGLAPPARFGPEVVARLLGLRFNHPAAQDAIELRPQDVATRAEAAYSVAQILGFDGSQVQAVRDEAAAFAPGPVDGWQRIVLQTAVSLIGYPYIWGGTSENAQAPFRVQVPGGFDCSGFVWRVYKLAGYAGGESLAGTLRGRTTYAMSGEVPKTERIPFESLEPADVIFFGAHGRKSRPAEVDHMGIYLGGGWFIHSSDEGVALVQLDGGYRARFAWGRRPLAEAGLS
jgi:cell wall-associated NlpC family hydrolase